jgi:lipoprotein-releasing system ATP-binding protein
MSNINVLESINLCKTYADGKLYVEVLRDINLAIPAGEMVAVLGTSGEGKSTLLYLLGGLDEPTSGIVKICGENLTESKAAAQGVLRNRYLGFIYQFHHLLPEFDVVENVCMPLLIRHVPLKKAKPLALELLEKVGLTHRVKHRIGEISGGERQRVAIARALITNPVCVLADEPTGNLDHKTAEQISDLLINLNQELKISFLIVTHDQKLASRTHRRFLLRDTKLETL